MIGQTVTHYRLLEKLGEGGMGVVYKALDLTLERPAALKFLAAPLAGGTEEGARLAREARAASALNHPNILTIYELGEHQGQRFIAMEWVEGEDLRARLRRGPLEPPHAVDVATQVAAGLAAAHARGIFHRDVKPANVLLGVDGRVKLSDFGLARMAGVSDAVTATGMLLGTAQYMSPEQVQGQALDRRSDVFAFGAVLYEMLTGEAAFAGDYVLAVLYAVVHREPHPLEAMAPAVPPELAGLVWKCLRKSPAERYASFEAVVQDLRRCAPELASPPSRPPRVAAAPVAPPLPGASQARSPLSGRRRELEVLESRLALLKEGRGGTVILSGESGIGKSRLAGEVMDRARERGCSIFQGRCLFRDATLPYQPYASAFKTSFEHREEAMLVALAERAAALGVSLTGRLPFLRAFLGLAAEAKALANREQLWDSVLQLLCVIAADRPVLLVLDDLQWADPASLGLLAYLARHVGSMPVLQLGMLRPPDRDAEPHATPEQVAEWLRQLRIEGVVATLDLSRLSEPEERSLLASLFPEGPLDESVIAAVREAAQGHPLFLVEFARLLRGRGLVRLAEGGWGPAPELQTLPLPERVYDVIAQRLERVTDADRELLELAACAGDPFESDVLGAILGLSRIVLLRRLHALEREHRLLRHEGVRYRFDHPLVRQVLHESMLPELRAEYHRLIARQLVADAPGREADVAGIAHHLLMSGARAEALEHLLRAAERATHLHASDQALALFHEAQGIAGTGEGADPLTIMRIDEGLGDAASAVGRGDEAVQHHRRFLEGASRAGAEVRRATALRKLAESLRSRGDTAAALEHSGAALELAARLELHGERVEILQTRSRIFTNRGEYTLALDAAREALERARELSDLRGQAESLDNAGLALFHLGHYRGAVEQLERAHALRRAVGDLSGLATTLNHLGLIYYRLGEPDRALDSLAESVRVKRNIGDRRGVPGAINAMGDTYRDLCAYDRAVEYHLQSLKLAREQANRGAECDNLRDLGQDHLMQGNLEEAARYLEEVLALARATGHAWYEARGCITLGDLHLAAGRDAEARRWSQLGVEHVERLAARELMIEALWGRARVLERVGEHARGLADLERAIDLARSLESRPMLWRLLDDRANRLSNRGRNEEATTTAGEARTIVQAILAHLSDPDLRATFLAAPAVRRALGTESAPARG